MDSNEIPCLPLGTKMHYNLGPKPDSRHLSAIIRTLAKELITFLNLYAIAKKHNEAGYFQEANQARSRVESARIYANNQKPSFPPAMQEKIELAMGKISSTLDNHPAFPEALCRKFIPTPLSTTLPHKGQKTVSDILIWVKLLTC